MFERNFHLTESISCSYIHTVNVFICLRILYSLSAVSFFFSSLLLLCLHIRMYRYSRSLCQWLYTTKKTDFTTLVLSLFLIRVCNVDKEKFTNKMCAFRKKLLFALCFLYEFYNKFFLFWNCENGTRLSENIYCIAKRLFGQVGNSFSLID